MRTEWCESLNIYLCVKHFFYAKMIKIYVKTLWIPSSLSTRSLYKSIYWQLLTYYIYIYPHIVLFNITYTIPIVLVIFWLILAYIHRLNYYQQSSTIHSYMNNTLSFILTMRLRAYLRWVILHLNSLRLLSEQISDVPLFFTFTRYKKIYHITWARSLSAHFTFPCMIADMFYYIRSCVDIFTVIYLILTKYTTLYIFA